MSPVDATARAPGPVAAPVLPAAALRAAAHASGFALAGFAPAGPLDPGPLQRWLDAGHDAGMHWMRRRVPERLDPRLVLPGARTVIALAIPHAAPAGERSPVARYARGRDYHYAHRDRMRALRRRVLALDPGAQTYACADTGVAMEKAWAQRAGLGWIGKNGCLISPTHGSWITLSVMFMDRAVDAYDTPHANLCGDCSACLPACPTGAFPAPGVVDARRCIAYHTIENRGAIPADIRPRLRGRVFGCDVCQEACPWNRRPLPSRDPRLAPRPLGLMAAAEIAALPAHEVHRMAAGMALARAGSAGLRRNALLAIGLPRAARAPHRSADVGSVRARLRGAGAATRTKNAPPGPGRAKL